jgi:lysophospholipase L1-like esterase
MNFKSLCGAILLSAALPLTATSAQPQAGIPWIGTWTATAAAETALQINGNPTIPTFSQTTLRQFIFTSVGGSAARLHFSNEYGTAPLVLGAIHIGQADPNTGDILAGTDRVVTFGGATSVTIPIQGTVTSDPVNVPVPANSYMGISTYFPSTTPITDLTTHLTGSQAVAFAPGDLTAAAMISAPTYSVQYYFLTALDVQNPTVTGAVVTLGASITDGFNSTLDANHRWSNYLSERINAANIDIGVLNEGSSGGDMLVDNNPLYGISALHRFNRDVLSQPGVRWVIWNEFDDLGGNTAATLIAGVQTMMAQAQQNNIQFICSTFPPVSATGSIEAVRLQYNAWIRTPGNGCASVVDQDAVLRDPNKPNAYAPQYFGTADGLHPNDAGYQAIANAVDLSVFSKAVPPAISNPASCTSGLTSEQTLAPNVPLMSCDGRFSLLLQTDGNLVVLEGAQQLWASGTAGKNVMQGRMLADGNFVLYDNNGREVWATNTDGFPGSNLLMQNDGNLVMYDANHAVWNTATCCH